MPRNPTISPNIEDYLERIYELIERKGYARAADIADALHLGRPSVSIMAQRLAKLGFIRYEKYRGLTLTDRGLDVARRIQRRHVILTEFFTLLELDRNIIAKDVEGIEHHLSAESLAKLERILEYWTNHPQELKKMFSAKSRKPR